MKNDELMWKKGIIRSRPHAFTNAECVFVEYRDCIHFTGYVLLHFLQGCYRDIFGLDLDPIRILNDSELLFWYCKRKNRNFLLDLWDMQKTPPYGELDAFLEDQFSSDHLYSISMESNVVPMIKNLQNTKFAKTIVVYSEIMVPGIEKDIRSKFGDNVIIKSGDLSEALETIPTDSTYIFSDAEKILTLEKMGKLDLSAILVPQDFDYNFTDDGKLIVNIDYLQEKHVFHFGTINLCGF